MSMFLMEPKNSFQAWLQGPLSWPSSGKVHSFLMEPYSSSEMMAWSHA